jgi:hypothetical protein
MKGREGVSLRCPQMADRLLWHSPNMADQPPQEKKPSEINQIDLSALAGFSFGTQWTDASSSRPGGREAEAREDRGRRAAGGEVRRDRRPARRPSGGGAGVGGVEGGGEFGPERRESVGGRVGEERGPRGAGGGARFERRSGGRGPGQAPGGPGGPRFEGARGGERGGRFERGGPRGQPDHRPYLSPFFDVAFYAEDAGFSALVKAIRSSCRTYELFEIAKVILGKSERFVVVVTRKPDEQGIKQPLWITPMDGVAFETEDEAVRHVMEHQLGEFFDQTEVEVEPPKGNFQFVVRCGFTGELLGPPNYHRYQSILQQHHAARLSRMPFERFKERLETVREPEVVQQWLERMKRTVQYTWKAGVESGAAPVFTAIEDARTHLLAHARERIVKQVDSARFHGRLLETLPQGEIRRAIEGHLERQRRFPLDTANALRGRLRREGFTIFKKGSKGVSYVCAVKRKFRLPGQVFSPTIAALIAFIETHPMVNVRDLPVRFLGLEPLAAPDAAPIAAPAAPGTTPPSPASAAPDAPGAAAATDSPPEAAATTEPVATPSPTAEAAAPGAAPAGPRPSLSEQDEARLRKMWFDLRWLVTEGYVTEFSNGNLYASPPAPAPTESGKHDDHAATDEHTDFPTAPDTVAPAEEASADAGEPASAPPREDGAAAAPVAAPEPAEAPETPSPSSDNPTASATVAAPPGEAEEPAPDPSAESASERKPDAAAGP